MECLAAYSSDESSLSSDHVRGISASPVNDTIYQGHQNSTISDQESNTADCSRETDQKLPSDPPLLSYLQEYSMNIKRQINAFAYLPWQPSREAKAKLRAAGDVVLKAMKERVSNFENRFSTNSIVAAKAVAHGMFGHTNSRSLTDLHVSLFPNMTLPQYKYKELVGNSQRAIKSLQIPPEILVTEKASALDKMLSNGKASGKRMIRFKMDGKLHLYKLTKTGLIFLGIGLSKFAVDDPTKTSPQFDYLTLISTALGEVADSSNVHYNWMQFNVGKHRQFTDISSMYYHFTVVVCELLPRGQRMSDPEYLETRKWLDEIDSSQYLDGLYFEADHLVLKTVKTSKKISLV